MQRYLLPPERIQGNKVSFTAEELHHLLHVMRYREGERVIVGDGIERSFLVEITQLTPKRGEGIILEILQEDRELPVRITLAQALTKGDKMDWIVQKATELGVSSLLPFTSSRTIVKLDRKKEEERLLRWKRIAKEAAEQCHRVKIPDLHPILSYQQLLLQASIFDAAFIPYEQERNRSLFSYVRQIPAGKKVLILIGPEGGFSEDEVEDAMKAGMIPVSLGKRILRTETAGIVALSAFLHHYEGN